MSSANRGQRPVRSAVTNSFAVELFLTSLAGLIVVAGPWKAGIVFAERTLALPPRARRTTGYYTVGIATVVGVIFIVVGEPVLEFFHISEAAFLVGAGLLVVVFSLRMVLDDADHAEPGGSAEPDQRALNLAIYPLSVPLLVTPPAIASLVSLGVIAHLDNERLVAVIAAFLVVQLVNLAVFLLLARFEDGVNPAVFLVAGRILGVLLVAFGTSIVIDGLKLLDVI